jgi:hypothetical protein
MHAQTKDDFIKTKKQYFASKLQCNPDDDLNTIRKQYYKLAKETHPDKSDATTTANFTDIQEAYEMLTKEEAFNTFIENNYDDSQEEFLAVVSDLQSLLKFFKRNSTVLFDETLFDQKNNEQQQFMAVLPFLAPKEEYTVDNYFDNQRLYELLYDKFQTIIDRLVETVQVYPSCPTYWRRKNLERYFHHGRYERILEAVYNTRELIRDVLEYKYTNRHIDLQKIIDTIAKIEAVDKIIHKKHLSKRSLSLADSFVYELIKLNLTHLQFPRH